MHGTDSMNGWYGIFLMVWVHCLGQSHTAYLYLKDIYNTCLMDIEDIYMQYKNIYATRFAPPPKRGGILAVKSLGH